MVWAGGDHAKGGVAAVVIVEDAGRSVLVCRSEGGGIRSIKPLRTEPRSPVEP